GVNSLKNANNVIYTYRTANSVLGTSNGTSSAALTVIDISSTPETFPYGTGTLSNQQLQDFIIVPTGDLLYNTAISGTISTSPSSNIVNGSASFFFANLAVGDYVYVTANVSGGHDLKKVTGIISNTKVQLDSATSFTNATGTMIRVFPANQPIPFGFRS